MPFDGATLPPQAAYLLRGKNYLLEHGWNHNGPGDERGSKSTGGPVCMMLALGRDGAVEETRSVDQHSYMAAAATFAHILKLNSCLGGAVGFWNDAPERTLAEVLDVYDQAIALEMTRDHAQTP